MKYGERLRRARQQKQLSQEALARASGVGQGSISKIERGDQQKSAFDIPLAKALDISPEWLKTGNQSCSPEWLHDKIAEQQAPDYKEARDNKKTEIIENIIITLKKRTCQLTTCS